VVVALSRRDVDALLDLLVENQAEWQDALGHGWTDPSEAPYWVDGTGERIINRLSAVAPALGSDQEAS
jgi:hypothetical protein